MGDPFVAFYPSDWLAGTRGLTAAETGVYITLVAMMYERGEALAHDPARLARLCGLPKASFERALETLISEKKITRTDEGLWQKRVSEELKRRQNIRDTASKAAKTRWEKTQQNQQNEDADAMRTQCGNDANQNHNQSITLPNGSDGQAVDFTKEVFDRGIAFLGKYGTPEKQARALIGKWRKQSGDTETFNALRDANREGVTEPVAWITARLRPRDEPDLGAMMKEIIAERKAKGGER